MDTFLEKKGNLVINTNIICTKYFHDCKNAYMSLIRWIKTGWNAILIHMKIAFFFHFGQFVRFENFVCFYTKNCNTTTQRTYLSWIWISWLLHVGCYIATMTQPFSILPFFPISFSFPNSIYNLLENNIYKFWFVIVVFFGSRRARARRSSDAFSFLIGRKYVVMSADVSLA